MKLQLDEACAKYETARVILPSVNVSLRHLLLIVNQAAAAYNTPVPTPDQVLSYMRSVPYLSFWINPEK